MMNVGILDPECDSRNRARITVVPGFIPGVRAGQAHIVWVYPGSQGRPG